MPEQESLLPLIPLNYESKPSAPTTKKTPRPKGTSITPPSPAPITPIPSGGSIKPLPSGGLRPIPVPKPPKPPKRKKWIPIKT